MARRKLFRVQPERRRWGESGEKAHGPAAVRPSQWRGWWTVHVSGKVAAPGVGGRRVHTPASEATAGQRACRGLRGTGSGSAGPPPPPLN